MALYRSCKHCGEPISLRQMPAGQWVAFDIGSDEPHVCKKAATSAKRGRKKASQEPPARTGSSRRRQAGQQPAARRKTAAQPAATRGESPSDRERIFRLLEQAINERRCVRMTYYTASRDAVTERVVEPLLFDTGEWGGTVLRAYCRWRQDFRAFALSNIRKVELLDETFVPRKLPTSKLPSRPVTSHVRRAGTPVGASGALGCIMWLLMLVTILWTILAPNR